MFVGVTDVGNKRPHRINQWKTREARVKAQKSEVESKRSRPQPAEMRPHKGSVKKNVSLLKF